MDLFFSFSLSPPTSRSPSQLNAIAWNNLSSPTSRDKTDHQGTFCDCFTVGWLDRTTTLIGGGVSRPHQSHSPSSSLPGCHGFVILCGDVLPFLRRRSTMFHHMFLLTFVSDDTSFSYLLLSTPSAQQVWPCLIHCPTATATEKMRLSSLTCCGDTTLALYFISSVCPRQ
jgi:hypothetical protein